MIFLNDKRLLALAAALTIGCSESAPSLLAQCNPLGTISCSLPWPSSAYLREDNSTQTGLRVDIPSAALPANVDGVAIDPAPWNRFDGFGPAGTLIVAFPNGVSATGLPSPETIEASLSPNSPIILINVDTKERVPFFAEVDQNWNEPAHRTLLVRPMIRMAPGTRHVVAIRDTVTDVDGSPLPIPPGFRAILDGEDFAHPRMDRIRPGFDSIFAALADQGVSKDELVLAWDFTTASDEGLTADMRRMRALALPAMGEDGANLSYQISRIDGGRLFGSFEVPNFLSNGQLDDSVLMRDPNDAPLMEGSYSANFAAIIPRCVETATGPVPVVLYGHSLFGTAAQAIETGSVQRIADEGCLVLVATDWIGLSTQQVPLATVSVRNLNMAVGLVEKLPQAIINFIALQKLVRGPLMEATEFQFEDALVYDPERVYYYGRSLGGIMGGVFMSYDADIELGVLGVPGAPWSLVLERTPVWALLQNVATSAYPDKLFYQQLIALFGMLLEPVDPITTAPRVLGNDELLAVPGKKLLLYEAVGDSTVTNLATETYARTLAVPLTGPSVAAPYGLTVTNEPVSSALTIYDEHAEPAPEIGRNVPMVENETHSAVSSRPAVLRQVFDFFATKTVTNQCGPGSSTAPCDCATGACE